MQTGLDSYNKVEDHFHQERSRQFQNLYAAFISLDEAFFILDQDLKIVFINDKAKEFGHMVYDRWFEEGTLLLDLLPLERKQAVKNYFLQVLAGNATTYEIEVRHGEVSTWLQCSYKPVQTDYGITGVSALIKDITLLKELEKAENRRRTAERKHQESKLLFQTFMENTPLTAWITDTDGVMHYLNPTFRKVYQLPLDDQPVNMNDIFPKDLVEEYLENNRFAIEAGELVEIIERTLKPDGSLAVFKVFKFPMQIGDQKMIGGWSVDITEEIKLQEQLSHSIERYSYVNEATSDAIYDWDVTTQTIYGGKGFGKLFGFHYSFVTLDFRYDLIHPDDLPLVKKTYLESLSDPSVKRWNLEFRFRDVSGNYRNVMDKAFIIREGDKAVRVIGAFQDITDIKLLNDKLLLQEKSKKRAIVRSIIETQEKERRQLSVELHDNVNQILSSCKLMLEVARENKENAQALTEKSYQSLKLAIAEIRKISHDLNPSAVEDFGLQEAISEMIEKINLSGKLSIRLLFEESEKHSDLKSEDKIAVYRIVQEQINNILKHANATNVFLHIKLESHKISLVIEDDGIGFDPHTTHKGLGLKNIHHRVEYYHGKMDITSSINKGCRLSIVLSIGQTK